MKKDLLGLFFFIIELTIYYIYNIIVMSESLIRSRRVLRVFEGIFLIFFSTALLINMGYAMRGVMAAYLLIFGHGVYIISALTIFEGFFLIIAGRMLLPKKWQIVPFIILCLSVSMLISTIELETFGRHSDDIIRNYFTLYKDFEGGYYQKGAINLFSVPFGGGIFGYLLAVPFAMVSNIFAMIFPCIFILVMLFIMIFPSIRKYKKNREAKLQEKEESSKEVRMEELSSTREEKREKKREKKVKEEKPPKEKRRHLTREEKLQEKYRHSFVNETDLLAHADEVGDNEASTVVGHDEVIPVTYASIIEEDEMNSPIRTIRPSSDTGTLERAQIDLFASEGHLEDNLPPIVSTAEIEEEVVNNDVDIDIPHEEDIPTEVEFENEEIQEEPLEEVRVNESKPVVEERRPPVQEVRREEPKPVVEERKPVQPVVEEKPVVQVKSTKVDWVPPSTANLESYQTEEQVQQNIKEAEEKMEIVNQAFHDFNIPAQVVDYVIGPSITRLLIDYTSTGSVKTVAKVVPDISRRLSGVPIRFEETVPGTRYSGFEVPNPVCATVSFKEVFEALPDPAKHPTAVPFGKNITGEVIYADICKFPHMLVSGTSGSGKSVFVNSIITSLIARTSPYDLKLVLVDPKRVEMNRYRDEPHLLCPVINEASEAKVMLEKMVDLMNKRYQMFESAAYATDISDYNCWANENGQPIMPYIVIILDEYADLVYSCKEVSVPLLSITAKARACGIHVIVSTQRPSTDVITGTIKANLNTRVSLAAASGVDSTTILDETGAEDLLGHGDMLVKSSLISRSGLTRLQGCNIKTKETMYIVNYLKKNYQPEYLEEFLNLSEEEEAPTVSALESPMMTGDSDEEKYQWIKEWAMTQDYVSMSKIQRDCSVGFNRAGRIVRRLQDEGILSTESEGSNRGFKVIKGVSRFNDSPSNTSDEVTSINKKKD